MPLINHNPPAPFSFPSFCFPHYLSLASPQLILTRLARAGVGKGRDEDRMENEEYNPIGPPYLKKSKIFT